MKELNREQILSFNEVNVRSLDLWGGTIYVRTMSGKDWEYFESIAGKNEAKVCIRAFVAACCICSKDGKLLFTREDVPFFEGKPANELDKIFDVGMELNQLGKEDQIEGE